jgi:hypothetical protein
MVDGFSLIRTWLPFLYVHKVAGLRHILLFPLLPCACFAASNRCKETGTSVVASALRHGKDLQGTTKGSKKLHVAWII